MILRDGLLSGVALVVAGAGELGGAVVERARALGAGVERLDVDPRGEEAAYAGADDVLVVDGAALFAGAQGTDAVRAALDGAWSAVRPVATAAMLERGGRVVLLAPPEDGSPEAAAARAGLENLARTLSVEWARFQIRPVAVLPGRATSSAEVAELVAFLASPAGEYYSGCAFTLGEATA